MIGMGVFIILAFLAYVFTIWLSDNRHGCTYISKWPTQVPVDSGSAATYVLSHPPYPETVTVSTPSRFSRYIQPGTLPPYR